MDQKAGAQISKKAFIQSVIILLLLMLIAGILTLTLPAGNYQRVMLDGRETINPDSFTFTSRPNYPIYRWITAPIEILWGPDAAVIITIIVFILMVGGAFAVLDKSGILTEALNRVVRAFGKQKYLLLLTITFFFMALGAFFGLFEEIVPLVPLMIALSYSLGWDLLVGLGMSILATNMGFSAAITNPFTIGVAQKLAGLPLFSGAGFRLPVFLIIYAVTAIFLVRYAKRIERDPTLSLVYHEDNAERAKYKNGAAAILPPGLRFGRAAAWFSVFLILIIFVLFGSPFIPFLSEFALPLVGLLFFAGGLGAGFLSGAQGKVVWKALLEGLSGIAPGIPLILMAGSIKHIITHGGVMDTILHSASGLLANASPFWAAVMIYILALLIEFFIGSAGAKAVLMMPIILPLSDLVGVSRQVTVTAYCFGDGFSNLAYPTNPVLLIVLGLAAISYTRWIKWTARLWLWVIPITVIALWIAVAIGLGPF